MNLSLSSSGRLSRGAFVLAVGVVYVAGFASQILTAPLVLERFSLWPFAIVQLFLLWCWYALHARRLRDAGRSAGLALGVAIIYMLALVLLLMVLFFMIPDKSDNAVPLSSIIGLYLVLWLFGVFGAAPSLGAIHIYAALLFALASAPLVLVIVCTVWAGLRRTMPPAGAPA